MRACAYWTWCSRVLTPRSRHIVIILRKRSRARSRRWTPLRPGTWHNGAHGTLSQGEQQRVLIARAVVARPALLILDEPCAGLDPVARDRFMADVNAFVNRPEGPTTVLVTHHIEEVGPWITHGLALRNGSVIAQGEIGEVLCDGVFREMLDTPCRVRQSNGRYRLELVDV